MSTDFVLLKLALARRLLEYFFNWLSILWQNSSIFPILLIQQSIKSSDQIWLSFSEGVIICFAKASQPWFRKKGEILLPVCGTVLYANCIFDRFSSHSLCLSLINAEIIGYIVLFTRSTGLAYGWPNGVVACSTPLANRKALTSLFTYSIPLSEMIDFGVLQRSKNTSNILTIDLLVLWRIAKSSIYTTQKN